MTFFSPRRARALERDREQARASIAERTERGEGDVVLSDEQASLVVALAESAAAWCDHYAGLVQIDNRADLLRIATYEAERDRYRQLADLVVRGWPRARVARHVDLLEAITHGELS